MTVREPHSRLAVLTVTIYWGCLLLGISIPWLATIGVDIVKHDQSLEQALHQLRLHLFAPGYNLFLIAVANALPFVLFAVLTLFHLGLAPAHDQRLAGRRATGICLAALGMIGLSIWVHVMTLWYPDAQGALAYLFLPFWQVLVLSLGYIGGRLAGGWFFR
ncbi:MAG: hypothetical protein OEV08_03340 [Nitrospira sp.]|nr:hypothetical protein [Nitrospira sp.]